MTFVFSLIPEPSLMLAIVILGALACAFLVFFWLTPLGVPALKRLGGGRPSPDLSFGYTADHTYRLLDAYGERGRAHWRRLLLADMIFPAVYGAWLALLGLAWVRWVAAGPVWSILAVALPVAAAGADYVENLLLLRVLAAWPRRLLGVVAVASVFTRIKFVAFAATVVLPLAWFAAARFTAHSSAQTHDFVIPAQAHRREPKVFPSPVYGRGAGERGRPQAGSGASSKPQREKQASSSLRLALSPTLSHKWEREKNRESA
jgi:hypothetical protein